MVSLLTLLCFVRQGAKSNQLKSGIGVSLPKGLISITKHRKHLVVNHRLVCLEQSCLLKLLAFTQTCCCFLYHHPFILAFLCLVFTSTTPLAPVLPPPCACRRPCSGLREPLGDYHSLEAAELMWGSGWRCLADSGGARLITKP